MAEASEISVKKLFSWFSIYVLYYITKDIFGQKFWKFSNIENTIDVAVMIVEFPLFFSKHDSYPAWPHLRQSAYVYRERNHKNPALLSKNAHDGDCNRRGLMLMSTGQSDKIRPIHTGRIGIENVNKLSKIASANWLFSTQQPGNRVENVGKLQSYVLP